MHPNTIQDTITKWVADNFGQSEAEDPSWNIKALADHLATELFGTNQTNSGTVTTHDIHADGKDYILEWTKDEENHHGYVAITEACKRDVEPCEWFINKATTPSWCCNTHMYDGTGDYPATGKHPVECDFAESDLDNCDESHETYDFAEVQ